MENQMNEQENQNPSQEGGAPEANTSEGAGDMGAPTAPAPTPSPEESAQPAGPKKSVGPVVGAVVIAVLLILAGFYFWGASLSENTGEDGDAMEQVEEGDLLEEERGEELSREEIENAPDPQLEALENQSSSDEIADIESDLGATELEDLDSDIEAAELEFN